MQPAELFLFSFCCVTHLYVITTEEVKTELLTQQNQISIIGGSVHVETRQMTKQLITDRNIITKMVEYFGNTATLVNEMNKLIKALHKAYLMLK